MLGIHDVINTLWVLFYFVRERGMKDNAIETSAGIEVYQSKIQELCDEYIAGLTDQQQDYLIGQNKALFTGMIKYIYINHFKDNPLNNNDIDMIDRVFNIYTSICYKYFKRPSLLGFSILTGISNDTFNAWKNGEYRNYVDENGKTVGSSYSLTVKKWLRECELALVDGATEQNSIGCIFALKANYGYSEGAQQITLTNGDAGKTIDQIAAEHRQQIAQTNDTDNIDPPAADF